jgi:hypothetical protein
MRGQTEVVVRATHDDPLSLIDHLGALVLIQGNKIGIDARFSSVLDN